MNTDSWKETWGTINWEDVSEYEALKMVKRLIAAGVDVNLRDKNKSTALMKAAVAGFSDVVEILIAKGVDVNAQNRWGWTALMQATQRGYSEIVQQLMDAKANRTLKNKENKTVDELAAYEPQSHAIIGQRIDKTSLNPHGFQIVNDIPYDKPAVLMLGGSGTKKETGSDNQDGYRSANGYLSDIECFLNQHGLKGKAKLYSIIYNFGRDKNGEQIFDDIWARRRFFFNNKVPSGNHNFFFHCHPKFQGNKFVHTVPATGEKKETFLNGETLNPMYVDELFNKAFLHRICDENGNKLSTQEACKRMRNLTVVGHCHGAFTFLKIEEKMQQKMAELGYSKEERDQIQKQLLCVACAPEVPLGISKSTMISFASSDDAHLTNCNNFSMSVRDEKFPTSYLPGKRGEVFLTQQYEKKGKNKVGNTNVEHAFFKYADEEFDEWHTEGWLEFRELFSNAIANGVLNSVEGKPLPSVEDLVCGKDEMCRYSFNRMKENGEKLWNTVVQKTKIRLAAFYNKDRK